MQLCLPRLSLDLICLPSTGSILQRWLRGTMPRIEVIPQSLPPPDRALFSKPSSPQFHSGLLPRTYETSPLPPPTAPRPLSLLVVYPISEFCLAARYAVAAHPSHPPLSYGMIS